MSVNSLHAYDQLGRPSRREDNDLVEHDTSDPNSPFQHIQLGTSMPGSTRLVLEMAIWRDMQVVKKRDNCLKTTAVALALPFVLVASALEAVARAIGCVALIPILFFGKSCQIFYLKCLAGFAINLITIPTTLAVTITHLFKKSIIFGTVKSFLSCCISPWMEKDFKESLAKVDDDKLFKHIATHKKETVLLLKNIQLIIRGKEPEKTIDPSSYFNAISKD